MAQVLNQALSQVQVSGFSLKSKVRNLKTHKRLIKFKYVPAQVKPQQLQSTTARKFGYVAELLLLTRVAHTL